jgi:hypothetical protein
MIAESRATETEPVDILALSDQSSLRAGNQLTLLLKFIVENIILNTKCFENVESFDLRILIFDASRTGFGQFRPQFSFRPILFE